MIDRNILLFFLAQSRNLQVTDVQIQSSEYILLMMDIQGLLPLLNQKL